MRNVSKRWNAPILCNVLRSCSAAQNRIVSNIAISSVCRNTDTVCGVNLWFTCNYVNGGRFLSERCMFWERCLFWERCMFLERYRFCERCNYNVSVQIFFTFEPVVPPYIWITKGRKSFFFLTITLNIYRQEIWWPQMAKDSGFKTYNTNVWIVLKSSQNLLSHLWFNEVIFSFGPDGQHLSTLVLTILLCLSVLLFVAHMAVLATFWFCPGACNFKISFVAAGSWDAQGQTVT